MQKVTWLRRHADMQLFQGLQVSLLLQAFLRYADISGIAGKGLCLDGAGKWWGVAAASGDAAVGYWDSTFMMLCGWD